MKIAIIGSRGIPARYGGFEIFAERLAQRLPKLGIEVEVYCKGALRNLDFSSSGVKRRFLPCPSFRSMEKLCLSNLAMLRALLSSVDGVLLLGVSGALFVPLLRLLGKKTVINPDGIEWKRSKWGPVGKAVLKFLEFVGVKTSHKIVADSMNIGKYIRERYGKEASYIPYGADPPVFSERDWESVKQRFSLKEEGYYIAVGRDVPENNFSMIIQGFLRASTGRKLAIVSDLGESFRNYSKEERVIFTGPIYERSHLFALRKNAYAHIHGHSVGGTNPSLLEAMASGNLVLAYDVSFNREVLGEAGLYFSSSLQLSKLIEKAEREREKLMGSALNYYQQVLNKRYNWELVARKYAELLKGIKWKAWRL